MSGTLSRWRYRRVWLRQVCHLSALATLVFLLIGSVLAWFTAFPRVDSSPRVDAILVLASKYRTQDTGYSLAQDGITDLLIVSVPEGTENKLCGNQPAEAVVVCFTPDPVTTQGEAMVGTGIARTLGAHSLGVLTFDHHIERAKIHVDRCWDGPVRTYALEPARDERGYVYDFVYAMAAYGKTFLTPGCSTPPVPWLQAPIEWIKSAT